MTTVELRDIVRQHEGPVYMQVAASDRAGDIFVQTEMDAVEQLFHYICTVTDDDGNYDGMANEDAPFRHYFDHDTLFLHWPYRSAA